MYDCRFSCLHVDKHVLLFQCFILVDFYDCFQSIKLHQTRSLLKEFVNKQKKPSVLVVCHAGVAVNKEIRSHLSGCLCSIISTYVSLVFRAKGF